MTDIGIQRLLFEIGARAAGDYIIQYRRKLKGEDDPVIDSKMQECVDWFRDVYGPDITYQIVRDLRQKARYKHPNGIYKRWDFVFTYKEETNNGQDF